MTNLIAMRSFRILLCSPCTFWHSCDHRSAADFAGTSRARPAPRALQARPLLRGAAGHVLPRRLSLTQMVLLLSGPLCQNHMWLLRPVSHP